MENQNQGISAEEVNENLKQLRRSFETEQKIRDTMHLELKKKLRRLKTTIGALAIGTAGMAIYIASKIAEEGLDESEDKEQLY